MMARLGYVGVVDRSLNQTIMRSVNTSLVVLLPILSLLLFGGKTLKDFAFAMFVGTGIGAYSSIFIAAPILTIIRGRESQPAKTRAARPAPSKARATSSAGRDSDAAAVGATARQGGSSKSSRPRPSGKKRSTGKRKRR
jgi:hypothetical protein